MVINNRFLCLALVASNIPNKSNQQNNLHGDLILQKIFFQKQLNIFTTIIFLWQNYFIFIFLTRCPIFILIKSNIIFPTLPWYTHARACAHIYIWKKNCVYCYKLQNNMHFQDKHKSNLSSLLSFPFEYVFGCIYTYIFIGEIRIFNF